MSAARRLVEAILALVLALVAVPPAALRADDDAASPRPRVTIRGTGNDVHIDRTAEAGGTRGPRDAASPPSILAEAIRRKSAGATDDAVVGYLRAHASEMPAIVDVSSVRSLRRAGSTDALFAYLSTVAALDIGPTAQRESPEPVAEISSGPGDADVFEPPAGYPFFGAPGGSAIGARRIPGRRSPSHTFVRRPARTALGARFSGRVPPMTAPRRPISP